MCPSQSQAKTIQALDEPATIDTNEVPYGAGHLATEQGSMTHLFQRWIPEIFACLTSGSLRYGEIQSRIPDIGSKTLARKLRRLCRLDLVIRTAYDEIPPRVVYSLSLRGQRLAERVLDAWHIATAASDQPTAIEA